MAWLNGKEITVVGKITLKSFLIKNDFDIARIAVECDGVIVPKANYSCKVITDDNKLEVVSFVGGG